MSSSSSASSCVTQRRPVIGVPSRCWCGRNLKTFCSQTVENPFRRFYRCEAAIQRKSENHLFKWVDEALLDETRMVDANLLKLVDEVKEMKKELVNMAEEMKTKTNEEMKMKTKEELDLAFASIEEMAGDMYKKVMVRVVITMLVLGLIVWFCYKYV